MHLDFRHLRDGLTIIDRCQCLPPRREQNSSRTTAILQAIHPRHMAYSTIITLMDGHLIRLVVAASVLFVSEGAQHLKVEQHCRTIAELAAPLLVFDSCIRREREAYETIIHKWKEFDPADRAHCTRLATLGDVGATYTSLLTCLEINDHVRKFKRK